MAIDLKSRGLSSTARTSLRSNLRRSMRKLAKRNQLTPSPSLSANPYHRLLLRLFAFLARRLPSAAFPAVVLRRLLHPRRIRSILSLSSLLRHALPVVEKDGKKTFVMVGTVSDDIRVPHNVTSLKGIAVAALRMTTSARQRLLSLGAEVLSLDELALRSPTGAGCVLLRGPTKSREAEKHFGLAPGQSGSTSRPYIRSKGRKFEKARGRRKNCGYKI